MTFDKIHISKCNWTDVRNMVFPQIAILPWGACEPHGEHLSYSTDSLLAEMIAHDSVLTTNDPSKYMILPPIHFGSQNNGQTNKKFCIHMSIETKKMLLKDIVMSLRKQGVYVLVIINGHNGNNFKEIVRDLNFEFDDFTIYVCSYLDIVSNKWLIENVYENAPKIDDHAGFTETSLMIHYFGEVGVNTGILEEMTKNDFEDDIWRPTALWCPRDWDIYSINTRIGYAGNASKQYGGKIVDHVRSIISEELDKIYKLKYG